MSAYVTRRVIQTILLLLALSFLTYSLMGLMPGDPLDVACAANPKCTPQNLEQMKHNLGLDRPIVERYAKWLGNLAHGDFGYSRTYRQPVMKILLPRLGNTVILGVLVLLFSFVIAIPIGVLTSLKEKSKLDYVVNFFVFGGISAPSFWLGLMLIIVFSVYLKWFPAGGVSSIGAEEITGFFPVVWDRAKYLVLPVAALSCLTVAGWVRYTRASMIETMRLDFIRTAKAKGLSNARVVLQHGLRNALLPIVTVIALHVPRVVSGAVITETVFTYQGIGWLMWDSINKNDFNVAMCSFLITCTMVLVTNLIADVCYAYLDPRISLR